MTGFVAAAPGPGVEWILFAFGGVLTLVVAGVFLFVLTRKSDE